MMIKALRLTSNTFNENPEMLSAPPPPLVILYVILIWFVSVVDITRALIDQL